MNYPPKVHHFCLVIILTASVYALGCDRGAPTQADDSRPVVVATTTMLVDLVQQIAGDTVVVEGILSPGADPHLYQPTPGDARRVSRSNLVVRNGLFLEGWIDGLIANAGGTRPIVTASESIDPVRMEDSPGGVDPHFWFDVQAWLQASDTVAEALQRLVGSESENAGIIARQHQDYRRTLKALHEWVIQQMRTIPEERRILVTSHDAFTYFGRAYDVRVEGIQGISTEQEASQRDVANMIELVRQHRIPSIFIESSVNPALIRQVARETSVAISGPLYSDSVGPTGSGADSYVTMFVENVRLITEGLGGNYSPFTVPSP